MKQLVIIISLILCLFAKINAQEEQIYKPLILQVEEKKETITYVMDSYSYSISKYYKDSISGKPYPMLQLNLSIQTSPDKTLVDWLTTPDATKNIKILCRHTKSGETYRSFTLNAASIMSWNESFTEYYMKDNEKATLYLEITCKEFSIDNFPLKGFKSPYDE